MYGRSLIRPLCGYPSRGSMPSRAERFRPASRDGTLSKLVPAQGGRSMGRLRGPQFCIVLATAGLAAGALPAQDLRVSTGTIEDRRTTGRFFAGLEVELKLTGDDLADAKSARILLKKAVDETGRDLLPEKKPDEDFKSVGSSELKLSLKNPARGASQIKEIAGEVQLFVPTRDPAAVVTVDRLL